MNINNKLFVTTLKYSQITTILVCLNITKIISNEHKLDLKYLRKNIEELEIIFNNSLSEKFKECNYNGR